MLDEVLGDGVGLDEATGFGSFELVTLVQGVGIQQTQLPLRGYRLSLADALLVVDQLLYVQGASLSQGVGVAMTSIAQLGITLRQTVGMADAMFPNQKLGTSLLDGASVAGQLIAAWAMSLTDTAEMDDAPSALIGLVLAEQLGIIHTQTVAAIYQLSAAERVRVVDSLGRFFGGDLSDGMLLDPVLRGVLSARPALSDTVGLTDALAPRLLLRVATHDAVDIDFSQALQMFFSPVVVEGVELSAGYVSPSGAVTTWAMNTSTAAVTEYSNYAFNSFAQRENICVGASDNGLYELVGDSDDGADIVATIKSGFMQFAGAKFGLLKRIYMAQRGTGDYLLKVLTGDDKEYIYSVSPGSMTTARVHLGKGLRARYFAFELVSTGQDFDLESLEFVPLPAQRRV